MATTKATRSRRKTDRGKEEESPDCGLEAAEERADTHTHTQERKSLGKAKPEDRMRQTRKKREGGEKRYRSET